MPDSDQPGGMSAANTIDDFAANFMTNGPLAVNIRISNVKIEEAQSCSFQVNKVTSIVRSYENSLHARYLQEALNGNYRSVTAYASKEPPADWLGKLGSLYLVPSRLIDPSHYEIRLNNASSRAETRVVHTASGTVTSTALIVADVTWRSCEVRLMNDSPATSN